MKKLILIISAVVCVLVGIAIAGYTIGKRVISDVAIKNRLVNSIREFGKVTVEHAHLDITAGLVIDNLSFTGTTEDTQGKSLKIPKLVLKYDVKSLLKGQININHVIIVEPELTIEKPTDIWSLLNAIKTGYDKANMPIYVDALRNGVEIRDLKLHVKADPNTKSPEIILSGIDITFSPYAGSFQNIIVKGNIDDAVIGNYTFTMNLYPDIPKLEIDANAKNLMVNEGVCARFPYIGKMLWDNYKPVGKINLYCIASFDNRNSQKKIDYSVNVDLNGVEAIYENWPFLLYNLNGDIEVSPDKLYLRGLIGYIKSGNFSSQAEFNGEFDLYGDKKTLVLNIPNLFINQELLKNIPDFGAQVWEKIQPTGLVDMSLQCNVGEKGESANFLVITCKDLEIKPHEFPKPISHVNGQFKLCNNIIVFKNASGFIEGGDQSIYTEMNGIYDMKSGRKIFNFQVPNLTITESFLKNLPHKEIGEKLWTTMSPSGKVDVIANFQGYKDEKDNDYSVEINLKDCEIRDSKYKIPLWGMAGRLEINKDGFATKHIDAKCCGGHIEGTLSVNTTVDPFQYEGELNFSRIIIEELTQKIVGPWTGILYGRIKYRGSGADPKNFSAEGRMNVSEGYLSDVPIILSVFNFLDLGLSKRESFHSAQVKFVVKDGVIHIDDGRIYSDTVELNGRGDIGLNGNLHLNVVAGFSKGIFSQLPIVGRFFDLIVGGVRKQLTMVEIRGTFLKPESHAKPFKPLTNSIKSMFELLPQEEHIGTGNAPDAGKNE